MRVIEGDACGREEDKPQKAYGARHPVPNTDLAFPEESSQAASLISSSGLFVQWFERHVKKPATPQLILVIEK